MIVRELAPDQVVLIPQEDHADLAAQFAAHWGNARFGRIDSYPRMLFATTYHDSQFRDIEAELRNRLRQEVMRHGH